MTDEMRARLLERITNPATIYTALGGPTGLIHLTEEERDALVKLLQAPAAK